MRQGARFSAVARQFSQAATAAVGGDMGWLRPDQLPTELGKAVARLKTGRTVGADPYGGGYYLLLVLDRRARRAAAPANRSRSTTSCRSCFRCRRRRTRRRGGPPSARRNSGTHRRQGLPDDAEDRQGKGAATVERRQSCRRARSRRRCARSSSRIADRPGVAADRAEERRRRHHGLRQVDRQKPATGARREEVAESLLRQRLDTVSRRYLRDLRRNAYVDVRV